MPVCRLIWSNFVTGLRMAGKLTRNNCPFGSPSPVTTLHPVNKHVRLMPGRPNESRTIRRVCASATGVQNADTRNSRQGTMPARRRLVCDFVPLIVVPFSIMYLGVSVDWNFRVSHLHPYSLGSNAFWFLW